MRKIDKELANERTQKKRFELQQAKNKATKEIPTLDNCVGFFDKVRNLWILKPKAK